MLNSRLLIADGLLFVYILWLTASIQYGSIASTAEKWFRFTVKMFAPILVLNALSVMGDGPNWHSGRHLFVDACHRNYWKNLLFINNFENQLIDICNPFTWILAVIFQLQIISPFLMIPFRISPKWGFITAAFCYAMSVLGIVWSENFKDMNKIQNKLNLNIWFIFGKMLWSFGNVWLIYSVYSNRNGAVNRMLSAKPFRAITRLTFGFCLVAFPIIKYRVLTRRENIEISHTNQLQILYLDFSSILDSSRIEMKFTCTSSGYKITALANQRLGIGFYKIFDATAKIPSGLTTGVVSFFGEYDQCLQIKSPTIVDKTDQYIYGKYCLLRPYVSYPDFKALQEVKEIPFLNEETNRLLQKNWTPNINFLKLLLTYNLMAKKAYLFHFGVCIPSTCDVKDVQSVVQKVYLLKFNTNVMS
ncbi:unnamed protein product [Medioppia subpectinata]|uniref:Nose resistant-to-fluoxetine protein N-terminal domain-containing protein n=1 Tax=Medioppia subpectinata TaxID=1979941 RepID=A0A7R9L0J1_9ACAR|nr:unnamed protein product [Medioppia subpectinata]CAG2113110.1 unnamed protein product [Medioppia subpectinata]